MAKEKKETKVVSKAPEKKLAWILARNVQHDGTIYKKGALCPDDVLKAFKDKGFVEEA